MDQEIVTGPQNKNHLWTQFPASVDHRLSNTLCFSPLPDTAQLRLVSSQETSDSTLAHCFYFCSSFKEHCRWLSFFTFNDDFHFHLPHCRDCLALWNGLPVVITAPWCVVQRSWCHLWCLPEGGTLAFRTWQSPSTPCWWAKPIDKKLMSALARKLNSMRSCWVSHRTNSKLHCTGHIG